MKRETFMKMVATGTLSPIFSTSAACSPSTPSGSDKSNRILAPKSSNYGAGIQPISLPDHVFSTIASFQSSNAAQTQKNNYAEILGYYQAGDGGGGEFYWDAEEKKQNHNGGSIIDPDHTANIGKPSWYQAENKGAGCWKRVQSNFVDVKWFGCKGNYDDAPQSDDTYGLIEAFNFANALKIPIKNFDGTYVCNKTIEVTYLNLEGQGKIVRTLPADEPVISVKGRTDNFSEVENDMTIGSNIIKDSALAHEIKAGDLLLITSNKNFGDKTFKRPQGEICKVRRIAGDKIYTSDVRQDTYLKSNHARVAKIKPATFRVSGDLTIDHRPNNPKEYTRGIEVAYCLEPKATLSFVNITRHAFVSYSCYKPVITVNSDNNGVLDPGAPNTGEGQPIIINGATMYGKFYGTGFYTRHAIAAGAAPAYPGVSWENHVIDFIGIGGGNTQVFDAHSQVGSIYFENCTAIGGSISDPDIETKRPTGFQLGARRNYIKNCTTINCRLSVLVRNDASEMEVFHVNNLRAERGSGGINFNNPSLNLQNLIINDFSAEFSEDGRNTAILLRSGKINHYSFSNIDIKNGSLIDIKPDVSIPETLIINNFSCNFSTNHSLNDKSEAISIDNNKIDHLRLANIHTENAPRILSVSSPLKLLELINVDGNNAETDYIYINENIGTLIIKGGNFNNTQTQHASLIKILKQKTIDKASIAPSQISGANLTHLIEGPGSVNRYILGGNLDSINTLFSNMNGNLLEVVSGSFSFPSMLSGYGPPEGNVDADSGTRFLRKDGEADQQLYIKKSKSGNTGWTNM